MAHWLSNADLFVSDVNPKLIKDFSNNSLRKVKADKADAVKIARYALDNWANLKQYSLMDEIRNQLKTMNRQFDFYMKQKTALKNNLISLLDQTYPNANAFFDSSAEVTVVKNGSILPPTSGMWTVYGICPFLPLQSTIRNGANAKAITSRQINREKSTLLLKT